jgi:hypothetical protein
VEEGPQALERITHRVMLLGSVVLSAQDWLVLPQKDTWVVDG